MKGNDAISNYREAKQKMASIIDRHMSEAFEEINQEFGATPVKVDLKVTENQQLGERYAQGIYAGCEIELAE